ncbi:metalloregulator ArsR/SmtB family transcription factor [Microbulbifer magnicolonia]|uniref:metalloregulator ArsR/SmtB family transcription factor n=1 Tax=Microbulbifer magnicolonia TaxID=3109744 RepID=UPI002B4040AC|nr:metalloregulator ArsR/SmtB family transcription factor [Microbulbifer sp. GG15]
MNPLSFYKCLADETRLRSLLLIAHEGELCVCELTAALGESQPKISRHLAQLRNCELLQDRRQGQWVFYSINPSLPDWARKVLNETLEANRQFVQENLGKLCRMGDRPERARLCC